MSATHHGFRLYILLCLLATGIPYFLKGADSTKVFVKEINIKGLKRTKAAVVFREMALHIGDSIEKTQIPAFIEQSRQQVTNTLLFIYVYISDSLAGSELYLKINVKERWYVMPTPAVKFDDQNFSAWLYHGNLYRTTLGLTVTDKNFRGMSDQLSLGFSAGWRRQLNMEYKTPYLNKKKTIYLDFNNIYQIGHEVPVITRNNKLQFLRVDQYDIFKHFNSDLTIGLRKKYKSRHFANIGIEYISIGDTISKSVNPQYLGNGRSQLLLPALSYRYIYDNRNFSFYATKGYMLSLALEQDGIPKDGYLHFMSLEAQYRKYTPLPKGFLYVFDFRTDVRIGNNIPYYYRAPLGYRFQIRGYETYLFEGQWNILQANEIKIKILERKYNIRQLHVDQFNTIPIRIFAKLHYDQGIVKTDQLINNNTLVNKYLAGYGAGLDFITYYDRIFRLEYSFNNSGKRGLYLQITEIF